MIKDIYPWQIPLWQQFVNLKQCQRLPQAMLLTGVHGLGKNIFAHRIVSSILCLAPKGGEEPCGQCHSCQIFIAGNHPDHLEVMPKKPDKQIKIEQIRQIINKQQLTPAVSPHKTIIISMDYCINVNANNSILKLLEEPHKNTLIILVTSTLDRIPITIKSRCQNMHMATPSSNHAIDWITKYSNHKRDVITERILQLSQGAPLIAIDMLKHQGAEYYQQIEKDFSDILSGRVNPIAMAASWQKFDIMCIINQLQYNLQDRIVSIQVEAEDSLDLSITTYWKVMDCIIDVAKLISSSNNINRVILIESFIVTVMQLTNKIKLQ